ncbi:hypothetical protein [Ralstonia insidiosa]|jgi:hypothetical protein|nr:hypothetical protein [Ralstonia insidiosa]MBA9940461.1 hypothetical protein [Ralstonia insidiosa]MBC9968929.1 hypothetical protein [Ralstonia insidiosa]MBX3905027.1 hypothetical protein [Ralstonia insidiosa]
MPVTQTPPKGKLKVAAFEAEMARRNPASRRDFISVTTVPMDVPNYDPTPFYATVSKVFGKEYVKEQRRIERAQRAEQRAKQNATKARRPARVEEPSTLMSMEPIPERTTAEIHAFIPIEAYDDVPLLSDEEIQGLVAR